MNIINEHSYIYALIPISTPSLKFFDFEQHRARYVTEREQLWHEELLSHNPLPPAHPGRVWWLRADQQPLLPACAAVDSVELLAVDQLQLQPLAVAPVLICSDSTPMMLLDSRSRLPLFSSWVSVSLASSLLFTSLASSTDIDRLLEFENLFSYFAFGFVLLPSVFFPLICFWICKHNCFLL